MYWIITEAGSGGEKSRISTGLLHLGWHSPIGGATDEQNANWLYEQNSVWACEYVKAQADKLPYEWRTLDDDGYLVYSGRCGDINDADQYQAFAPLDFSANDCGATTMEYRKVGESKWETL